MGRFRRSLFLFLVLSLASIGHTQTATTAVRGHGTDQPGDSVSRLEVVLTEKSIGFSQTHKTNANGEYNFQQIPPGSYQIKVSASGFSEQTTQAQLLVNQPATINVSLSVGSNATTVEVTAESTALNATDATIGTPFNQAEIQTLPFQGNNVFSLLSLQAGVLSLGDQSTTTMDAHSHAGAVNGSRSDQGNVTIDGVDNNTQTQGYAFAGALRPTHDSVEEIHYVTTGSHADSV